MIYMSPYPRLNPRDQPVPNANAIPSNPINAGNLSSLRLASKRLCMCNVARLLTT